MRWKLSTPVAAFALAATVTGCGDGGGGATGQVVVSAAASLETPFADYAEKAGIDAKQSFAGSDQLAAQIRQGLTPDVYAAADTSLPDELFAEGLVRKPIVFATNSLVAAVPAGSTIRSLVDLTMADTKIAIGGDDVPVGSYAREVLARMPAARAAAIEANVVSEEPDVSGIVGKLTQGAVDAGFLYATDAEAAGDEVRAIELPADLEPEVAYGVAVVDGAENLEVAERFIQGLLEGDGRDALDAAGFGPPPP